ARRTYAIGTVALPMQTTSRSIARFSYSSVLPNHCCQAPVGLLSYSTGVCTTRKPAAFAPTARVRPMLSVPHLEREFDYLVAAEQSDDAQPGVRVRVRFHGRLIDAFVLERRADTDHVGKLGWLDRVVSPELVLTPEIRRLVDAVATRYAG